MTLPPARTLYSAALAAALAAPAALAADPQGRPPRPAPANARVEALPPDLEATLAAWYEATRDVETLEGSHTELQTVHSAAQETHRTGRFFYAEPDRGRIDLRPGVVDGVAPQTRPGAPYAVVAGPAETWVCNGEDVKQIDDAAKEYRVTALPPDQRGANIINGPLPFLLGVPPETLKKRFRLRFVPGQEPKGGVRAWLADPRTMVMLELLPRREADAQNWSKAQVMLTKPEFLPRAVKLFGPAAGGRRADVETVYAFKKVVPNRGGPATWLRGQPVRAEPRRLQPGPRRRGGAAARSPGAGPAVKHVVARRRRDAVQDGLERHEGPRVRAEAGPRPGDRPDGAVWVRSPRRG